MNDTKKTTESETYFDDEILTRIKELSNEDMEKALFELESTHYWVAILKYIEERTILAQHALNTIDFFKEPTMGARHQGLISGLIDLQEGVIKLKQASKKKVAKDSKEIKG